MSNPLYLISLSVAGERAELARQHAVATLHREEALKRSEGELVTQLTELMDRVVRSRDEAVVDNTEVWSTQKYERQSVEFECDLCHNKVCMEEKEEIVVV